VTTIGPIAVGGTAKKDLYCYSSKGPCEGINCSPTAQFDRAYETDTRNGPIEVASAEPGRLEVHAYDAGTNELSVRSPDGVTYGVAQMTAERVDHIAVRPFAGEVAPAGESVAFMVNGAEYASSAVYAQDNTILIDDSKSIVLGEPLEPTRVDLRLNAIDIAGLSVGAYPLDVRAGDVTASLTLSIVDHVEQIVAPATTAGVGGTIEACFAARLGGVYVAGLKWHFVLDNMDFYGTIYDANCIEIPNAANRSTATILAEAGGQSVISTVQVVH
jgi:hypothetical protein